MKTLDLIKASKLKNIELPNGKIVMYNSINELPIDLFTAFQSYLMQDHGIGSDLKALEDRISLTAEWIGQAKTKEALDELYNLLYNVTLIKHKVSITHICFGCLVYSVDEVKIEDYSETGIRELLKILSKKGLTHELVKDYLNEVKKNLTKN